MILPTNCFQSRDLILLRHQSRRYVRTFVLRVWDLLCSQMEWTIVQVILSHEYRCFHCYRHEHSPNHRMFLSIFCNIWNSFLSFFALDHSPGSRMISILLTILILLHRFQWQIVEAMPFFEKTTSGSLRSFTEVLPHSQRIARFHHDEFSSWEKPSRNFSYHSPRNFLSRSPPIARMSSISVFPLLRRPSMVIITLWVACWGEPFHKLLMIIEVEMQSFGRCRYRVSPILPLSQQSYSRDFDFHNFSSPGLTEVEDDTFRRQPFATRIIIGRDFAVTRSSAESCWSLFCHCFRAHCRTEMGWYWTNTTNDFTRHVWKFPLVSYVPRVRFWCQCTWFGLWGSPSWFDRTTNQAQLCGSWKHVSLWDSFL